MTLIILLALFCAVTFAAALHPLMRSGHRRLGWAIMACGCLLSLFLYFSIGAPDQPSSHAAFQKTGPFYEQRLAAQRELVLLEALAGAPENTALLLELGTIRIQTGRAADALDILNRAHALSPGDPAIEEALGAAHYALALLYAIQPREAARAKALDHFKAALSVTPKEAEFFQRLKADHQKFQKN